MKIKTIASVIVVLLTTLFLVACFSNVSPQECEPGMSEDNDLCTAAETGPLGYTLFARGGFNGWGADNPFVYQGEGIYTVTLLVAPGNHEFKLAPVDWKEAWVIVNPDEKTARPEKRYPLQTGGAGSFLFVRKTGYYLFTLDFSDQSSPSLVVSETSGPAIRGGNPHRNHRGVEDVVFETWDGKTETVKFSVNYPDHKLRHYAQSTTQSLRDPLPPYIRYEEKKGYARVRSNNIQFDALFALAMEEMRRNSVSEIRDGNYSRGEAIACDCFETGAKWHYVWTRDLAYAADLGLAMFDPQRVVNSLMFKSSTYREDMPKAAAMPGRADGLQIVQDTGTGGSWPISTDRLTWAFGAAKVLDNLPVDQRLVFAKQAYRVLNNTLEIDRQAAFDTADGLYFGEQSFLDWREQSYSAWIVDDIASLGSSKSLSTNVGHYHALVLAADLALELGDASSAKKYRRWSSALKIAINERLWLPNTGLYSSMTAPHFNGAAQYKYDWLGISLAVVTGVAERERALSSLANYPHSPMGAPVIAPQQPGIPVYHNRAIWPFVSAYGLKAATLAGNSRVADAAYKSLIRAASLNLSNMENLEWLSGQPILLDENNPHLSGPVINSRRQLWSVAAYLGMVTDSLFGVKMSASGVSFRPFVSSELRRQQFADSQTISLFDLSLRNKNFDIKIYLPESSDNQGYYQVKSLSINNKVYEGGDVSAEIPWQELSDANSVIIRLGALIEDGQGMRLLIADPYATDDARVFAPIEPTISAIEQEDGRARIEFDHPERDNVVFALYRNGQLLRANATAADIDSGLALADTGCFSLVARYAAQGNASHHSAPYCLDQGEHITAGDPRMIVSPMVKKLHDRERGDFLYDFGMPLDILQFNNIEIKEGGRYAFQLQYHNAYNEINLGITNGTKWAVLSDENRQQIAAGLLQMPHTRVVDGNKPWKYSTPLDLSLKAGIYRLTLEDFGNMSYLQANESFTGAGGQGQPVNRFDVKSLRILRLD